jgi:hypothetical protein
VRDAGGQVDLWFYVLNRFPMTLSLGYAQGYADGGKVGDEWMVSLKIL